MRTIKKYSPFEHEIHSREISEKELGKKLGLVFIFLVVLTILIVII
jgi:hypothetical protein